MDAKPKTIKMEEIDQDSKEAAAVHHVSHDISYWTVKRTTPMEVTCDRAQTVADALQIDLTDKTHKELVILRGKRPVASHCPCWLIEKDDLLNIKYIKAEGNSEPPKHVVVGSPQRKAVIFHVETEGGPGIVYNILNNNNLKKIAKEVSVYAFDGETVECALKRDGRFKSDVFSKYSLRKVSSDNELADRDMKWSNDVKHLDDKTFRIIQGKPSAKPKRPARTSTTAITSPSTISSQPSATNVPLNTDTVEQGAKLNYFPTLAVKPRPIADSEKTLAILREQFPGLLKRMQDREGKAKSERELFRVEHGKNIKICKTVRMQRRLMVRADSVCQVREEDFPLGSGFLLFDKFILTCAHVIYDKDNERLRQKLTVSFCYEDLGKHWQSVPVKPVPVVFEAVNESGCFHDFALLELDSAPTQSGLLEDFAALPQTGGICIMGHPEGEVKQTDACFILPLDDREKVVTDRCKAVEMQLITGQTFDFEKLVHQSPVLAYDTCFSYGASGSPVFDEFCNVIAMHTGGYVYRTVGGQPQEVYPQSFIEYAQPLPRILPRILIRIVEAGRFDVLEAYLRYSSAHREVKEDVRRIAEGQNRRAFENSLKNYNGDSEKIKDFIQFFFWPQDDSEPMDI